MQYNIYAAVFDSAVCALSGFEEAHNAGEGDTSPTHCAVDQIPVQCPEYTGLCMNVHVLLLHTKHSTY